MSGMKGFHVSASGAIQSHHGPLVNVMYNKYVSLFPVLLVKCQHIGKCRSNITLKILFGLICNIFKNTLTRKIKKDREGGKARHGIRIHDLENNNQ